MLYPKHGGHVLDDTAKGAEGVAKMGDVFSRTGPYVLKEAEVRADGNSLGELGSRIVCETIVGLLRNDRNSFAHEHGRAPVNAVRLPDGDPVVTIRDFLEFAGVAN